MDEERTRETRARAERALVRLLNALGDAEPFLVVLGGLVPDVLTDDDPALPDHQGTTDVDILLITHVDPKADLGAVEAALKTMDFGPDPSETAGAGGRVRGIERVKLHADLTILAKLSCALARARAVPLAA